MDFINTLLTAGLVEAPAAGLVDLWNNVLRYWITPIYVAAVAVFALVFMKNRSWTQIIGFVGIAAIVGVLIFAGGDLFGGKDKGITGAANKVAKDINTVVAPDAAGSAFDGISSGFVK